MRNVAVCLLALAAFGLAAVPLRALNSSSAPKDNFDLSHWKLQLPVNSSGVLSGSTDAAEVSVSQLNNGVTNACFFGFTNNYFYTGPDGAMTFWVPDNGATTSGSSHPRSELREMLNPGDTGVNWLAYGTHVLSATCVVSNVPSDTKKVCIAQVHEQVGAAIPMVMIMFYNSTIYANLWSDGNDDSSSSSYQFGSCALGTLINYQIQVTNGFLSAVVNGITNSLDLFNSGANWQTNRVYFKAGAYSQTTNQCNCSSDGAKVAFYSLSVTHGPCFTNVPASRSALAGTNTTFSGGALGNGTVLYQWWFNGGVVAQATNSSLTLSNVAATNAGNYSLVASDSFGSVTCAVASLTVTYPSTTIAFTTSGTTNWTCPSGVSAIQVECWGGGGSGGSASRVTTSGGGAVGGGGSGGAYARLNSFSVTPGSNYVLTVAAAVTNTSSTDGTKVSGNPSWFCSTNLVFAKGGEGGASGIGANAKGAGGTGTANGSIGDVLYAGGSGGTSTVTASGGGGGGSGGTASAGYSAVTTNAAPAVSGGGPGGSPNAAYGSSGPGQAPASPPGGGGGGARDASTTQPTVKNGGGGSPGQVVITYVTPAATAPGLAGLSKVPGSGFQFSFTNTAGASFTVLVSTNLANWSELGSAVESTAGHYYVSDPQATNSSRRFYRVRSP